MLAFLLADRLRVASRRASARATGAARIPRYDRGGLSSEHRPVRFKRVFLEIISMMW